MARRAAEQQASKGEEEKPEGNEKEVEAFFQRIWYSVEMLRILSADEDQWQARFSSTLAAVLRPSTYAPLPAPRVCTSAALRACHALRELRVSTNTRFLTLAQHSRVNSWNTSER